MHLAGSGLDDINGICYAMAPSLGVTRCCPNLVISAKIVSGLQYLKIVLSGQPSVGEMHISDHPFRIPGVSRG